MEIPKKQKKIISSSPKSKDDDIKQRRKQKQNRKKNTLSCVNDLSLPFSRSRTYTTQKQMYRKILKSCFTERIYLELGKLIAIAYY